MRKSTELSGMLLTAFLFLFLFPCGLGAQTGAPPAAKSGTEQAGHMPDLSGVWRRSRKPPDNKRRYTIYELSMSLTNEEPPMTAWGLEKFKANKPNLGPHAVPLSQTNDPVATGCFPPGVPRVYLQRGEPMEIFQVPGRVLMLFEYDHYVRQIFTDGRQHPRDVNPSWMGDSIGHWEGNTLVVDTTGFNDKTWLDQEGHPHSEQLHLIERIKRPSHDSMTIDFTIEDPKAYTKPWTVHATFELKPAWTIAEMICEDNGNFSNLQKISEGK
jgi:hypothetical protein